MNIIEGVADLKKNKINVSERLASLPMALGQDLYSADSKKLQEKKRAEE